MATLTDEKLTGLMNSLLATLEEDIEKEGIELVKLARFRLFIIQVLVFGLSLDPEMLIAHVFYIGFKVGQGYAESEALEKLNH
jgi:hypothetical protein